jgi:uncharacterized protein (TIRG00374 family)
LDSAKKTILNILFLAALLVLTFYLMFRGQDLAPILKEAAAMNKIYLCVGIVLVVIFVCCESVIIQYLLRVIKIKWPLRKCIRYSFVGFFFSCITPSATGGQPAQIYYMKKEGLDIPKSTIVLLLVTIEYKAVLVFLGILIAILGQSALAHLSAEIIFYFYLGLVLNILCVAFMSFLVFSPNIARYLLIKLYRFLAKLRIIKHLNKRLEKLNHSMDSYADASIFLGKNKVAIFIVFFISLLQRLLLFFVTFIVYKGFGLHGHSILEITMLQSMISISVDMLPLPGGMGISERIFSLIFVPVFGSVALTLSGMLISRGISYYALILISAIVTMYTHILVVRKPFEKHPLAKNK